jgi:formyltetrahydrofolate deformylase
MINGNHDTLRPIANMFDIPYHYVTVSRETKLQQEAEVLKFAGGS